MPTDEAQLLISCRATGTETVNQFSDAVINADNRSQQLIKTLGGLFSIHVMKQFGDQAVATFGAMSESMNRFNRTFAEVLPTAKNVFVNLRKEFSLSEGSAYQMLASTGDLLTGFGMTTGKALELSDAAARLGMDLYSYTNYAGGAEGATAAITKAMLGEAESAKALGVVIRQDSEEFKRYMKESMTKGLDIEMYVDGEKKVKKFTAASLDQAKAIAVLKTAYDQSKNAIGDWNSPVETYTQVEQINTQAKKQLAETIGKQLTPAYSSLLKIQNDLLGAYNNAEPSTQRFILLTGGLTAGFMALKGAMASYQLLQGLTGTIASNNAKGISSETAAHIANAEAIKMENAARSVSVSGSISGGTKKTGDQYLSNAAYKTTYEKTFLKTGDALKANEAATARYNEVVGQQISKANIAATAENMKNQALASGATAAQANAIKTGYLAQQQRIAELSATRLGRAQLSIGAKMKTMAAGAKAAAGAVRGLVASMGPMLLLSGAIAGVDYLLNSGMSKANARTDIQKEKESELLASYQKNEETRKSDVGKLDQLETMSGWINKTKEEQEMMKSLMDEMNGKYKDLNLSLDENGNVVGNLTKAYAVMSEEQQKQKQQELLNGAKESEKTIDEMAKAINERINGAGSLMKDSAKQVLFAPIGALVGGIKKIVSGGKSSFAEDFLTKDMQFRELWNNLPDNYDRKDLENLLVQMQAEGIDVSSEDVAKVKELVAQFKKVEESLKQAELFAKGETEEQKKQKLILSQTEKDLQKKQKESRWKTTYNLSSAEIKQQMNEEKIKQYRGERQRLDGKTDVESVKKRYDLEEKILQLRNEQRNVSRGNSDQNLKDSLSDLDRQKQIASIMPESKQKDDKIKLINDEKLKKIDERRQELQKQMSDKYSIKDDRLDAAQRLLELTKQRGELESQIAQEAAQKARQYAEQENSFFVNLYNKLMAFKETTASTVQANSEQAVRLQTRQFGNGGTGLQAAAKSAADAAKESAKLIQKLENINANTNKAVNEIKSTLNAIGMSTAG